MIEWIKFKGSTEEERRKELLEHKRFLVKYFESGIIDALIENEKSTHTSSGISLDLLWCTHWAPLNLPQEEKITKACYCCKFKAHFEMPLDFMGSILCEGCDAFMNPQEEKWERKCNFNESVTVGGLIVDLNREFDNIYSLLNELRKR